MTGKLPYGPHRPPPMKSKCKVQVEPLGLSAVGRRNGAAGIGGSVGRSLVMVVIICEFRQRLDAGC